MERNLEISPFSRKRAFWVCLAAGFVGFHRVYCGKLWTGYFLMLLYGMGRGMYTLSGTRSMVNTYENIGTIMIIASIVWFLVDLIQIVRKDFRDKEGRRISEGLLFR